MKKVKNFYKFISNASRWKLYHMYLKATKHFREHHNNYYKPPLTQEEYVKWGDIIQEDWISRPTLKDLCKNRQFDIYHFPSLEASSKNPSKLRYSRNHLRKDLGIFFPYLPKQEVQRIIYVITFLIKEALKNYGNICIPEVGTIYMYDRPLRETHRAFTSFRWTQPRYRLNRKIEFYPSRILYNICTPRDLLHMGFEGKYNRAQYIPDMFGSFVDERIHRYRGRIFLTEVFTKHWEWLGYEDDLNKELQNLNIWDIIDEMYHEPNLSLAGESTVEDDKTEKGIRSRNKKK